MRIILFALALYFVWTDDGNVYLRASSTRDRRGWVWKKEHPDLLFSRSCDFLAAGRPIFITTHSPFMAFSLLCEQYDEGNKKITLPPKDELRQTHNSTC